MTPEKADAFNSMAGAYVHVPFCSAVCPYCDFAVVAGKDELAKRYAAAVVREVEQSDRWRTLDAAYLGGGTPSHVDPSLLGRILDALERRHGLAGDVELTLEANPEDFEVARAAEFRHLGFNRVSFGAQSFDGGVLTALGRRHDPEDITASMAAALTAGFSNVSVDLIYGTPGESDVSWAETLRSALSLEPDHISCYALTVERGTPLWRAVAAGSEGPDPDAQADRYEHACALLAATGYERYEVSNWARPGKSCRYNSIVWAQGEYVAYGNGAHGYVDGIRYRNIRSLEAYVNSVESTGSARAGSDVVEGWGKEIDRLFVGLRRAVGVAVGHGTSALVRAEAGKRLLSAGVIGVEEGRMVINRPLLTDEVHRAVLDLEEPAVGRSQRLG